MHTPDIFWLINEDWSKFLRTRHNLTEFLNESIKAERMLLPETQITLLLFSLKILLNVFYDEALVELKNWNQMGNFWLVIALNGNFIRMVIEFVCSVFIINVVASIKSIWTLILRWNQLNWQIHIKKRHTIRKYTKKWNWNTVIDKHEAALINKPNKKMNIANWWMARQN